MKALNRNKPTGYTTVLKLLQIMTEKGLVRRDEGQRAHVYEARFAQELATFDTRSYRSPPFTAPAPGC